MSSCWVLLEAAAGRRRIACIGGRSMCQPLCYCTHLHLLGLLAHAAQQGLVSGAVAERLGGVGALCCLGTGPKPAPLTVLNQMNLAPQHKAIISAAQLADLLTAAQVGPCERT